MLNKQPAHRLEILGICWSFLKFCAPYKQTNYTDNTQIFHDRLEGITDIRYAC